MSDPLPIPDTVADLDADAELYLSGEADAAAVARLEAALRADPAACERFVAFARLHGRLAEIGRATAAGKADTARLLAVGPVPVLAPPAPRTAPSRWPALLTAAAALLVVGLAVLGLGMAGLRAQALVPTVARAEGDVRVLRDGQPLAVRAGLRLRAGDRVEVEPTASLAITLVGGRCIIDGGSRAVVEAYDERLRRVVLLTGGMQADLAGREAFAVRTSAATISLADAAARITAGAQRTVVVVRRGQVTVQTAAGELKLTAGAEWRSDEPPALAGGHLLRSGG